MGGEEEDELELQALPLPMRRIRKLLLRLVDSMELPPNPLDQLTELLGGEGKVAEMTGRKGMLVRGQDGRVSYKQRREEEAQKMVNLKEKDDFMNGKKQPVIGPHLLPAGHQVWRGVQVRCSRPQTRAGHRTRLAAALFPVLHWAPGAAALAVYEAGCCQRLAACIGDKPLLPPNSDVNLAPEPLALLTPYPNPAQARAAAPPVSRFAGAVAKRLASLGALLQGDQRALGAAGNLKAYDIDNAIAHKALSRVYDDLENGSEPMPGVRIPLLPDDAYDPVAMVEAGGLPEELPAAVRRHAYHQAMKAALVDVGLARNV
ncbi:PHD-type domain-containing protein [Haematococcus lacustris]|uniref:PHD-type domain-containing protein n=1 Tax=Haematococcus lacustris TaxID=44745 RepID=A0A699ZF77_HAELA|nr:PHD-type domain-containing protein [Haematococcus lacustris]